jgi:hypothetical protein
LVIYEGVLLEFIIILSFVMILTNSFFVKVVKCARYGITSCRFCRCVS